MAEDRPAPPDPAEAASAAEFVGSLVRLRQWAGEPSLSRLRALGGQTVSTDGVAVDALPKSTTSHVLRQTDRLPRWDFVRAFVTACLRFCDYPGELIPGELERWRVARTALAGQAAPAPPPAAAEPVAGPGAGAGGRPATDSAVELLARRVAREEDRARKGLLGGYSVAPVSFGPDAAPTPTTTHSASPRTTCTRSAGSSPACGRSACWSWASRGRARRCSPSSWSCNSWSRS
ncbi:hypothetical protein ACFQYP_24120 [Nonomuraea antimicrobica]